MTMNKMIFALVVGCALTIGLGSPAFSNGIVGTVIGANGAPLQGAQVTVSTSTNQVAAAATTNQQGLYQIGGLSAGLYYITLDPKATNLTGQTVVTNVNGNGLTVNWATSPGRQAIATAQPGIRQPSVTNANSAALSAQNDDRDRCDGRSEERERNDRDDRCPKKSDRH
jgi:hypothetical protein